MFFFHVIQVFSNSQKFFSNLNRRLKLLQRSLGRRGCNKVCEELEVETSLVVALQATSDMEFTKRLLEYKEGLCTTDRYMDSNMYDKLI